MPDRLAVRSAQELAEDVVVSLLVDRSGSMEPTRQQTVEAYNEFIADRRGQPSVRFGGALFNHEYERLPGSTTHEAPPLSMETYAPSGGTALYDAIIRRIDEIDELAMPPTDVLFGVFTDGEDQHSSNGAFERARDKVRAKVALGWRFVFFAPSGDTVRAAAVNLGFPAENVATYADAQGITEAFRRLSRGTARFIVAVEQGVLPPARFFDEEGK